MPIYEYRCEDGHSFEVVQKMSDDPVSVCEVCSKPVQRVFHPVAVHFKGSGFYSTDYAKKEAGAAEGAPDDKSKKAADSDKKTESKPAESKPSESKSSESKPKSDD